MSFSKNEECDFGHGAVMPIEEGIDAAGDPADDIDAAGDPADDIAEEFLHVLMF